MSKITYGSSSRELFDKVNKELSKVNYQYTMKKDDLEAVANRQARVLLGEVDRESYLITTRYVIAVISYYVLFIASIAICYVIFFKALIVREHFENLSLFYEFLAAMIKDYTFIVNDFMPYKTFCNAKIRILYNNVIIFGFLGLITVDLSSGRGNNLWLISNTEKKHCI